ncbi:class I SAM-dependent methyltransferase [Novosphingobium aquimarinum]|uniref:class I SAM-dependent methyltransferase n=1 Tax=Novosphingobium aquimarinum TaxID=2682494 RepID=UPI0012EB742F|nr:class I SAM-dependent methyltransferase [Novosphingobium aquimarinum]
MAPPQPLPAQPLPACPLCSTPTAGNAITPLQRYEKDFLVRCRSCDFTFSLLDPTPEDYARVYARYDYAAEDAARTPLSIENERAVVERLTRFRQTGRVLDIAAGAGRFLEHFRTAGFSCHATEFSPEMCAYLEAKGFKTYAGGLSPDGAPENAFDVIVFTEVIEHTNRTREALNTIHRLLRPGGAVYITTPNFDSLERRIIGPSWGMLMWPEHITYWTPDTLDKGLRSAGFRQDSLITRNISPFRVVQALKKGRFGKALGNVSEQAVSDKAQATVASHRGLAFAKRAVNGGLRLTGLGSGIEAVYIKA